MKIAARLESHVRVLSDMGERSVRRPLALEAAANWIEEQFQEFSYVTSRQPYEAGGMICANIEVVPPGFSSDRPHYLIGAHYDSAEGTPGADDNISAVAILLELARHFRDRPDIPLRFAAFVNEEPPFFLTPLMGSRQFALRSALRREPIQGMLCLESLGVFLDEPNSQQMPYIPVDWRMVADDGDIKVGNFVTVVGNHDSMDLMKTIACSIKANSHGLPVGYASMPEMEVSDHLSFWAEGFPAVMITDTAMFRNLHYHLPSDTPEKLNYPVMAELFRGLADALEALGI